MAMMKSISQAGVRGGSIEAASGWSRLVAGLRALLPQQAAPALAEAVVDEAASAALFAQALHDDSNLELDWLWLAAQVTRTVERRYCLQRALYINPHSEIARQQLLKLRVDMASTAIVRVAGR